MGIVHTLSLILIFHWVIYLAYINCQDKMMLKPVELMDMILKEQSEKEPRTRPDMLSLKRVGSYQTKRNNGGQTNDISAIVARSEATDEDILNSRDKTSEDDSQHDFQDNVEDEENTEQISEAIEMEQNFTKRNTSGVERKMWGRWSKWSPCSVSCGSGVITRKRLCIAGHCAPNEWEQQLKPCARTFC